MAENNKKNLAAMQPVFDELGYSNFSDSDKVDLLGYFDADSIDPKLLKAALSEWFLDEDERARRFARIAEWRKSGYKFDPETGEKLEE